MKKSIIYMGIALLAGLLAGYLLFGVGDGNAGTANNPTESHDHQQGEESMWTCSMHPQVMQPEPGSCPICGMDLIPASAQEETGPGPLRMTENAMALADIRTLKVGSGEGGPRAVLLSGAIQENAEANTVQASYFDGRLEELMVTYAGQQIRKGQRLATIYSPALVAAQQELLTAAPLKASQPGLYKAVRNKLRNWKLTDTQIDQIETHGEVIAYFPINATVSGTVTEVLAAEGDYLQAGQPIARLSNLSTVWAVLDVYEGQLGLFQPGDVLKLKSHAYPGKTFTAEVSFIDPILDARTRTTSIRATLANPEGLLKPGMFIEARVEVGSSEAGSPVSIPASAVMWTGQRSLVYVKIHPQEPVFEMREVRLGKRFGDAYEVLGGLEPDEEIVSQGTFTVDAAAQLQGKRSMMNQNQPPSGAGEGIPGQGSADATGETGPWPEPLRAAYPRILEDYLALKDALVLSNPKEAASAVRDLQGEVPRPSGDWDRSLQTALENLRDHLRRFLEAKDDLDRQRAEFLQLSDLLIGLGQGSGVGQDTLFIQYCPMADDFSGAYWISQDREIKNPYFGDAMLTCGEVRDTWTGSPDL